MGCEKLDLRTFKEACPHVKNVVADLIVHSNIEVILSQYVFSAICIVGNRTTDNNSPWAVQLPIGWVVSGLYRTVRLCRKVEKSVHVLIR